MFDFSVVTRWIDDLLRQYMSSEGALLVECVLVGAALLAAYAVFALLLIYMERKVCAFMQCRIGPNRVGIFGILQTLADMIKILLKEIIRLKHNDRLLFNLASNGGLGGELIAFEARKAIDCISGIVGDITDADVLNNIFSRFCIGK